MRRHLIDNNSSIRIRGAITDVVVEHCVIVDSCRGIRVDNELENDHTESMNMLHFEREPKPSAHGQPAPYLSPKGVLLRKNKMSNVKTPYSGTALGFATVEKE